MEIRQIIEKKNGEIPREQKKEKAGDEASREEKRYEGEKKYVEVVKGGK